MLGSRPIRPGGMKPGSPGKPSGGEPGRGGGGGSRSSELESENRQLRGRLEAARTRVQELVTRLAFLEEQSREAGATGGSAAR